jgi:hypothetical protein
LFGSDTGAHDADRVALYKLAQPNPAGRLDKHRLGVIDHVPGLIDRRSVRQAATKAVGKRAGAADAGLIGRIESKEDHTEFRWTPSHFANSETRDFAIFG